jgi:signal transduction histidine kinase
MANKAEDAVDEGPGSSGPESVDGSRSEGNGLIPVVGGGPQAEDRVRQLLALNEAAISITGELELDRLLQRIVDEARELAGCKYAALGVLGDDGYIARFPTSGISEVDREKIGAPPRGHGLLGVMLRAGRAVRIPDMSKDPRKVGFPPHHPPMTSLLGLPLFVRGKLVGNIYLTDKIGGPQFDEEDEWLLQLLAIHAATALTNEQLHAENLRSLKEASRERARAQALLRVTQSMTRSVHLGEVIPVIVNSAVEMLRASGAAVFLLEDASGKSGDEGEGESEQMYVAARYAVGLREIEERSVRLSVKGSVAGRAMSTGQTQIVPDVSKEKELVLSRLTGDREAQSLVVVPLKAAGRVLGVLSLYSEVVGAFDEEAVEMLEAYGAQAAAALGNAQLYEQAEMGRRAAELEQQRLRELEQMKDEFLSTAAHELRTPLTSIRMSAGLALEQMEAQAEEEEEGKGAIDPRLLHLVELVLEGAERMHSLVNDLLDLTRLEQGRGILTTEDIDLREVVKESVTATMPLFEGRGQTLSVRLPEAYCGVHGDSRRLEQAVMNLLSNAAKYSPPGSQVEIRLVRSGDECTVMVRDNGPGVPEDEQERIFERFYRSSIHRQDRTPSTGLGLPITRKIAEMHRGKVWVEPAQGGGALFSLSLPLAA